MFNKRYLNVFFITVTGLLFNLASYAAKPGRSAAQPAHQAPQPAKPKKANPLRQTNIELRDKQQARMKSQKSYRRTKAKTLKTKALKFIQGAKRLRAEEFEAAEAALRSNISNMGEVPKLFDSPTLNVQKLINNNVAAVSDFARSYLSAEALSIKETGSPITIRGFLSSLNVDASTKNAVLADSIIRGVLGFPRFRLQRLLIDSNNSHTLARTLSLFNDDLIPHRENWYDYVTEEEINKFFWIKP